MSTDIVLAVVEDLSLDLRRAAKSLSDYHEFNKQWLHSGSLLERGTATMALASMTQSIYTKMEEVMKLLAKDIDGSLPDGDAWHSQLIKQMSVKTPDRPPVISKELFGALNELRRFRHVVRGSYSEDLNSELTEKNVYACVSTTSKFCDEVSSFACILQSGSGHLPS